MPVEIVTLLFALAAEPRPAPPPETGVSLELLEFLGSIDSAPAWVGGDLNERSASDGAPPPRSVPPPKERAR